MVAMLLFLAHLCGAAHARDSAFSQLLKDAQPDCFQSLPSPKLEPGVRVVVRADIHWGEPHAAFDGDHWSVFLPDNKSNPDPCRSAESLFRNIEAHAREKDWEIIKQHVGDEMSGFVIRLDDPLPAKKGVTGTLILDMAKAGAGHSNEAPGRGGKSVWDFLPAGPMREAWDKEIRSCGAGKMEENVYAGYYFVTDSKNYWECLNAESDMRALLCEWPEETRFRMVQEASAHVESLAEAQQLERILDWCRNWVEGETEKLSAQKVELRSCQAVAPSLPKEVRCRAAYLNADYLFNDGVDAVRRVRALDYYGLTGLCPES